MASSTTRLALRKPASTDAVNVTTDIDNNFDDIDAAIASQWLTTGQETIPRLFGSAANSLSTGNLRLAYFTARKSETSTQVRVGCVAGYSGGTPTIIRFGLFTIDGSENLTLVASTANDTSLLAAAQTYTKAWQVEYPLVKGTRYAFGALVVTAGTGPTIMGASIAVGAESGNAPRIGGVVGGNADMPPSMAVGFITNTGTVPYAAILP